VDSGAPAPWPTSDRAVPPVRWGLGDVVWIYVAGVVASIVGFTLGYAITGDTTDHISATTLAIGSGAQYAAWGVGFVYISRAKGRGSLYTDFGVGVRLQAAAWVFAGAALQLILGALVLPLVHLADNEKQQIVVDLEKSSGAKFAVLFVIAGLLAPIGEEILFRGLLLRSLRRHVSPELAIGLSSLIFAVSHLLDPSLGTVAILPALFALGAISAIAATVVGDLSISIPLHIGFNLVTLAAYAVIH
jgi:membrane protease YdiL (CAAX protease family)